MKIKQLGNGGGLASQLDGHVNSAFLVDLYNDHSEYLLFDCGYNIMKRLEEEERNDKHFEISKIKHVIISHKHDDHCGNLETLIYWNHFKNNVQMNIYVASKGLARTVKDTRKIEDNFKTIKAKTYESLTVVKDYTDFYIHKDNDTANDIMLSFISVFHGAKPAVGVRVSSKNRAFFISGDTKANTAIENFLKPFFYTDLVFHDYSNWDDESKNVHACKTDFEREYSTSFQNEAIKYHTGNLNFSKSWQ